MANVFTRKKLYKKRKNDLYYLQIKGIFMKSITISPNNCSKIKLSDVNLCSLTDKKENSSQGQMQHQGQMHEQQILHREHDMPHSQLERGSSPQLLYQ